MNRIFEFCTEGRDLSDDEFYNLIANLFLKLNFKNKLAINKS